MLNAIRSFINGFDLSMSQQTDILESLSRLLNRGGMLNMMPTIFFLITALTFGSMLHLIGTLQKIVEFLLTVIKGIKSLIIATWCATLTVNASINSTQFTFLTLGPILQDIYKKYKLHPSNLSRIMENGGTLTEPIIPWTVTGVYMATTLGVPTLDLPYSFFNLISIAILLFYVLKFPSFEFAIPVIKNH